MQHKFTLQEYVQFQQDNAGQTQGQIAAALGMSEPTLSQVLSGRRGLSDAMRRRIAIASGNRIDFDPLAPGRS